jgi:hypothetical protein
MRFPRSGVNYRAMVLLTPVASGTRLNCSSWCWERVEIHGP